MLHMRTWPGGPGTALGCDAGSFPWIFFLSLSPPPRSLQPPPSIHPHHRVLAGAQGWAGSAPSRGDGGASPSSKRLKSLRLVGHMAWRWQPRPFPELWGCSCSSAPGSIEPKPPLSPPSQAPAPLKPLLPSCSAWLCTCTPLARDTRPAQAPRPPATLLPPCSVPPPQNPTSVPPRPSSALGMLSPGSALCSRCLGTGHAALADFGLQPQKYLQADPVPSPGVTPVLCPLSVPSVLNAARSQPGPALHDVLLPARAASLAASCGMQASRPEQLKPEQSTQKKAKKGLGGKDGKCTYAK